MIRTQISLTEADRQLLEAEAARTGRSMSALIRVAVETVYGDSSSSEEDLAAIRGSFGVWDGRDEDGAAYVEGLRSGSRMSTVR